MGDQPIVSPQLVVRRGRAAIEFYKAAFGAHELYRVGGTDENEEVVAQLAVGDASFWVADEAPSSHNLSPESLGGSTVKLLLIDDDPRRPSSSARSASAPRRCTPWMAQHGWLLGRIEDPFGHHWEIGKPLVAWPPLPAP